MPAQAPDAAVSLNTMVILRLPAGLLVLGYFLGVARGCSRCELASVYAVDS